MATVFLYRVNRIQTTCIWAGRFGYDGEKHAMPGFLRDVLDKHIIVPKALAHELAVQIHPYGDDSAKMIEAYVKSHHHASLQEIGIGLALTIGKWTSDWPQFRWEVVDSVFEFGGSVVSWETIQHEWSLEQLVSQRKGSAPKPHGLDKEAWDMLAVVRAKVARNRRLRAKLARSE